MMYYRSKVLLAILEVFGGELGKIDLQKLLFLVTRSQQVSSYDFLPYHYGCYSYQSIWDLRTLSNNGLVKEVETGWALAKEGNYLTLLKKEDKSAVLTAHRLYREYSTDDLIRETYIRFPYYATKSKIVDRILTTEESFQVSAQVSKKDAQTLFTVGYEGLTIEKYFNKLIINNVRLLCDVRKNPLSQKVGFSKWTLNKICDALGIIYVHIPELGIESSKRQNLKTQADYNELFADYKVNSLVHQTASIDKIIDLLATHSRVALTCFEASHCQCHRGIVAQALIKHEQFTAVLQHL